MLEEGFSSHQKLQTALRCDGACRCHCHGQPVPMDQGLAKPVREAVMLQAMGNLGHATFVAFRQHPTTLLALCASFSIVL